MSDRNKATIRRVREELLSSHNLAPLDSLYADDYVYHGPPMLGDVRGQSAFRQVAAPFIEGVPDLREQVVDQIAEGDRVATRLIGGGTHTGTLMGVAGSGKPMTWSAIVISRFTEDGTIAEEWVEFDFLNVVTQIGAALQMPGAART